MHAVGARVNGRLVPLRHELKNGDTAEVVTQPSAHPSESWLTVVKTSRARQKIQHWLKEQRREDSIALGRDMLARELKRLRKPVAGDRDLVNVAQSFGFEAADALLAALGQGDVSVVSVTQRLHPEVREALPAKKTPFTRLKEIGQRSPEGIRIQGMGNLMIRLARCCQPVPGEQIVGMVTRGRGLSVHRVDCPNVFEDRLPAERRVELSWDVPDTRAFVVKLLVFGDDRKGMLADLALAVTEAGSNIVNADIRAVDGDARGTFLVEVNNLSHLQKVLATMKKVKGVRAVERTTEGGEE